MDRTSYAAVGHALGASDEKPKKEISHIVTRKSGTNGDHIHEHHHTHPEHHPKEEHTTRGDDEMAEHMMANMGTPNPGEAAADAGTPDAGASPAGSGAPDPSAGAAPAVAPGGPIGAQ